MGAEPGRRSLKMPAEKLGPVIVAVAKLCHMGHAQNILLRTISH